MRFRRVLGRIALYYAIATVVLAVVFGELAFDPERRPIDEQSAAVMVTQHGASLRDVSVPASDGVSLKAWLLRPAKANNDSVILLHGIGDNREGMLAYAEFLLARGYTVLMPDSRGQGESGGRFPTYGIKEADDVHRWFDWLQRDQRPGCIFGLGESMGAAVLLQAVKDEPRFCAVVAESSFASFRQIAYIRVGQIFFTGRWLGQIGLRPAVELALLYGRLTRRVNLAGASPEDAVAGTRVPILLIHGLSDRNIPAEQSERIRVHNPSDIALWEVPHADHCGALGTAGDEFCRRVLGWFDSHNSARLRLAAHTVP